MEKPDHYDQTGQVMARFERLSLPRRVLMNYLGTLPTIDERIEVELYDKGPWGRMCDVTRQALHYTGLMQDELPTTIGERWHVAETEATKSETAGSALLFLDTIQDETFLTQVNGLFFSRQAYERGPVYAVGVALDYREMYYPDLPVTGIELVALNADYETISSYAFNEATVESSSEETQVVLERLVRNVAEAVVTEYEQSSALEGAPVVTIAAK